MIYKEFRIKNFRTFKDIQFKNLNRINLMAGKNNFGKTSVLEAFFLHSGFFNPEISIRIEGWRGVAGFAINEADPKTSAWDNLFYEFDNENIITFESYSDRFGHMMTELKVMRDVLELVNKIKLISPKSSEIFSADSSIISALEVTHTKDNIPENFYYVFSEQYRGRIPQTYKSPFQSVMIPSRRQFPPKQDTDRFSKINIKNRSDLLLKAMKEIDERILDVAISTIPAMPSLYVNIGYPNYVPLYVAGEGVVKLTQIILSMVEAENGVVLIDEIENGFHYSILKNVWRILDNIASEFNVQLIATTHSLETIKAANDYFKSKKTYDFSFYRIEEKNKKLNSIYYDKELLDDSLDMELEIR